jgi:hypothetical protein
MLKIGDSLIISKTFIIGIALASLFATGVIGMMTPAGHNILDDIDGENHYHHEDCEEHHHYYEMRHHHGGHHHNDEDHEECYEEYDETVEIN